MSGPCYLLGSTADADRALRRLAGAGWSVVAGFTLPDEPWDLGPARTVAYGAVADTRAVAAVVLAAARGAAVVVVAEAGSEPHALLAADLARIGTVHLDRGQPAARPPADRQPDRRGPDLVRPGATFVAGPGDSQRAAASIAGARAAGLTPEQCALLDRLAAGSSIPAAAEQEFLSLRTANRRIADARRALGVGSTREAVLEYRRRLRG